jgi:predicted RNA-binding Zn ribbon-like protein
LDLKSYAELAVCLVNTATRGDGEPDLLASPETFRAMAADRPYLAGPVSQHDLTALRLLRSELSKIFAAAAEGADATAVDALNGLLVQHPVHPEIVAHGSGRWHVHLSETGSVSDRYAAAVSIGLGLIVTQLGMSRLGICAIASCPGVFIDASPSRSRRYCPDHSAARTNVTAIRAGHRAPGSNHAAPAAS